MLERVWASHAHSCKAPQSLEIVTNPGPLSGGESGCYQHSRKVTPVRGGGKNEARKVSQSCSGFCLKRYSFIVSQTVQCTDTCKTNTLTHKDMFCMCVFVCVRGQVAEEITLLMNSHIPESRTCYILLSNFVHFELFKYIIQPRSHIVCPIFLISVLNAQAVIVLVFINLDICVPILLMCYCLCLFFCISLSVSLTIHFSFT